MLSFRNEVSNKFTNWFLVAVGTIVLNSSKLLDLTERRRTWKGVTLADKILLNFSQYFKFSLLERFDLDVGICAEEFFDFLIEHLPIKKLNFVVYPVASFLVIAFQYFIVLLLPAFMIVLQKINKVSFFEISTDPVLLETVFQNSVALKNIPFKLPDVRVSIFEYFLSESVQLSINVVASFDQTQFESILISGCFDDGMARRTFYDVTESKPISKTVLLKSYDDSIA